MIGDTHFSIEREVLWLVPEGGAAGGTGEDGGVGRETRQGRGRESTARVDWQEADAGRFGAKGVGLVRLAQGGWPVSEGFVLSTEVYRAWRSGRGEWPAGVRQLVRQALERMGRWGWGAETRLAVRSGARRSHPGLLRTCLGVTAVVDDVLAAIARVCESVDSPEVRRAREWPGSQTPTETAIVVQRLIDTECAGVLFTEDPQQPNAMLVEAVTGLGDRLVAGEVAPFRWRLPRPAGGTGGDSGPHAGPPEGTPMGGSALGAAALRETAAGSSAFCRGADEVAGESPAGLLPAALEAFAREALGELCSLALRLEGEWGEPLDLEWGVADSRVWLLQARPTGAGGVGAGGVGAGDEWGSAEEMVERRLRELGEAGREIWVRHNLADSLPNPTPLSLELWRQFLSPQGGYGQLYRALGYRPARGVAGGSLIEAIGGGVYLDAGQLPGWSCRGYPLGVDLPQLLREPDASESLPLRLDLEGLDRWFLVRWPWVAWVLARAQRRQARLARSVEREFAAQTLPAWEKWLRSARRHDVTNAKPKRLCGEFERLRRVVFDKSSWRLLLPGTLGVLAWRRVQSRLEEWLGSAKGAEVAGVLLGSVPDPVTTEQRSLAARFERGEISAEALRTGLGHRAAWEFDLSVARWGEGATAEELAERVGERVGERGATTGSPTTGEAGAQAERDRAAVEVLRKALVEGGAGSLWEGVEGDWRVARRLLPYRGLGRDAWLRGWALLRGVVEELGRVTGWGDDIHFLTPDELRGLADDREGERARLVAEIAGRRQRHRVQGRMLLPPVLLAPQLEERLRASGRPAGLGPPTGSDRLVLHNRTGWGNVEGASGVEGETGSGQDAGGEHGSGGEPGTASGRDAGGGEESRAARVLSPGEARGEPWIYEVGSDVRECRVGAIVVARHVGAAVVPSLGRAAGIVVEQGGSLSHVALVARQLRLPVRVVEGAVEWARGARELVFEPEPARVVRVGGGR